MNELGMKISHAKRRGEWAEMCFMTSAAEHGLCVSKPWGETAHYDFVVDSNRRLLRVQVKSTFSRRRGKYICGVHPTKGVYAANDFDFIAAYLVHEGLWYIIPAELIQGKESIMISPEFKRAKYARFREAWQLLKGPEDEEKLAVIEQQEEIKPEPAEELIKRETASGSRLVEGFARTENSKLET